MRRTLALLTALALCAGVQGARAGNGDGQDFDRIARGRYLAVAGDCSACHTAPGGKPFAGGRPVETPFGTIVSDNITPDVETGIGAWTDDQFVRALTHGIRRDGGHLYPAMPYPYYTKASRDDLLAIRAYLATIPAVKELAGGNELPFPLNLRLGMAAWNELYFAPGEYRPEPAKSTEWNRGAYLVTGLMHCGACHTPKNFAGADKTARALQGSPVQGWFAPDITNATRTGLRNWSADDVVAYLKTGHNAFSAATGPMSDEVSRSSSRMTEADLHAVAVYLKDQPGAGDRAPQAIAAADPEMRRGAAIYGDECAACHAGNGTGQPRLFPSLAGSASVQSSDPTSLIRIVISGTRSVATGAAPTAPAMPSFGWLLTDRDAAAVLTFVRNSWGNAAPAVDPGQVHDVRKALTRRTG